jgi:hypothetical protein
VRQVACAPTIAVTRMVRLSGTSLLEMTLSVGTARRRKRDSSRRSCAGTSSTGGRPISSWRWAIWRSAQQRVGQPRLDRAPLRRRGHGLHQQPLQPGIERHHLHLGTAREQTLDDRAAQRDAHSRGELVRVLRVRGAFSASTSMMLRMSRM